MRHRVGGRKLGLPTDQRRALLRSLVSSILWHDEVDTTEARAKEASRMIDRIITLAKKDTLHARRLVQSMIFEQNIPFQGSSDKSHRDPRSKHRLLRRIFGEIAPLYRDVRGGYTRLIRLGPRRGDAAMMVRLELTKGISVGQRPAARRPGAAPLPRPAAATAPTPVTTAVPAATTPAGPTAAAVAEEASGAARPSETETTEAGQAETAAAGTENSDAESSIRESETPGGSAASE